MRAVDRRRIFQVVTVTEKLKGHTYLINACSYSDLLKSHMHQ